MDLWALYRVDTDRLDVHPPLTPCRLWQWITRAAMDPASHYRARTLGNPEFVGWGVTEYLLAAVIDAVRDNTVVTAYHGSSRRPKLMPPYPRPQSATHAAAVFDSLDRLPDETIEAMVNRTEGGR